MVDGRGAWMREPELRVDGRAAELADPVVAFEDRPSSRVANAWELPAGAAARAIAAVPLGSR